MGTKNNPGTFDCYENADDDEPMFVLLARDSLAPQLVMQWAALREGRGEDPAKITEARFCAAQMRLWQEKRRAARWQERVAEGRGDVTMAMKRAEQYVVALAIVIVLAAIGYAIFAGLMGHRYACIGLAKQGQTATCHIPKKGSW